MSEERLRDFQETVEQYLEEWDSDFRDRTRLKVLRDQLRKLVGKPLTREEKDRVGPHRR